MTWSLGIDIGGTSIKAAALRDGQIHWTNRSRSYARPDQAELIDALAQLIANIPQGLAEAAPASIGVCAPGVVDEQTLVVTKAVNVPGLVGLRIQDLVVRAVGVHPSHALPVPRSFTDAHAAAVDFRTTRPAPGRLLAISLGTGIGAAVLDDDAPLIVSGRGPGHVGQLDVSCDGPGQVTPIGPDGGRGGLEAYMGLPALKVRFGKDLQRSLDALDPAHPPLLALVRALRIAHAIYRPQRIALLGGVGLALSGKLGEIDRAVRQDLTSVAREGWTLEAAVSSFHAAGGAARLGLSAARSV